MLSPRLEGRPDKSGQPGKTAWLAIPPESHWTAFDEKILRRKILWWREGRKRWVVWEGALKVTEISLIYSF